jgi:hypothetical protein
MRKALAILLPVLGAMFVLSTAEGAQFTANGTECVQNFTTASEIKFDNSNGTAVNSGASIRNYFCGGTANSDKVLQSVNVLVVDRSAVGAVECRAFNGAFSVGPVASAGSDASIKTLTLNITDSTWFDAIVKCDVPAFAAGLGSGVTQVRWFTN